MTHAGCERVEELLEAFHYGDLEGEERGEVERHVVSCGACRAALEAVRETASALDRMDVPEPKDLDWARLDKRIEAQIAPLRTRRALSPWLRRERLALVAASFLIGTLGVLSAGLFTQVRGLERELSTVRFALAEQSYNAGDVQRFELLVTAPELRSDPAVQRKLEAIEKVGDPEVARRWQLVRQAGGEEEMREKIAQFLHDYPKHPLAKEATNALRKKGMPTLRPLDEAVLHPIPLAPVQPLPGETVEEAHRRTIDRLREDAARADPKAAAGILFQAAEIAERRLADRALAADLYGEVLKRAPGGPIRTAAEDGLARVRKE